MIKAVCLRASIQAWLLALTVVGANAGPSSFRAEPLPTGREDQVLVAWTRPALAGAARYRVLVLPGSGCSGWAGIAEPMFRGLQHAELWLLHKPGVSPWLRVPAEACPPSFVRGERFKDWAAAAQGASQSLARRFGAEGQALPVLLIGFSEGAELLGELAPQLPGLKGLVMVGSSGLDPAELAEIQAVAGGDLAGWRRLQREAAGPRPDDSLRDGRSLGYWRDLLGWRSSDALLDSDWELLRAWGGRDALVPPEAYARFLARAALRKPASFCDWPVAQGDHGLQLRLPGGSLDDAPLQALWQALDDWSLAPATRLCPGLRRAGARMAGD